MVDVVQGQLREQLRQLGELDVLGRQVQEQIGLIKRLGGNGRHRRAHHSASDWWMGVVLILGLRKR